MGKNISKIYLISFSVILFFSIVMVIIATNSFNHDNNVQEFNKGTLPFDDGWVDVYGNAVDLENLHLVTDADTGKYVSITKDIPANLGEGQSISFFARHIYYQVYVDGELVDEQYAPEGNVFNKSYGHDWTFIQLLSEHAGKELEIRYICPYSNEQCCITDMCIGRELGIALNIIGTKFYDLVTSILLLFLGIIFVIVDIPINMQKKKNHELLYLGLIALCIGVWSISETQVIQLFTGNSRQMNLISHLALMLVSMPAVLYAYETMETRKNLVVHITCGASILYYVTCIVLHFSGILDLKQTLIIAHGLIIMGALYIMYAIIFVLHKQSKKKINIYILLRLIGIAAFGFSAIMDLYRFYTRIGEDCAAYVRIGMLILVMCYGFASMERTIRTVQAGIRSELLSKLAYEDGLTGIGNRTAFMERIEELQIKVTAQDETVFKVGIVMFDVNNLKLVNDCLGHQCGDHMIVDSANIIKNAFEDLNGECFRIGGDEFSVIIKADDAELKINTGLEKFISLIEKHNLGENLYNISIARGYAIFDSSSTYKNINDICELADKKMYENKKLLKNNPFIVIKE